MLNRRHLLVLTAAAGTSAWIPRNAAGQTPAVPSGAEAAFDRDASAEELVMAMFTVQSGTGSDTGTVGTTEEQVA